MSTSDGTQSVNLTDDIKITKVGDQMFITLDTDDGTCESRLIQASASSMQQAAYDFLNLLFTTNIAELAEVTDKKIQKILWLLGPVDESLKASIRQILESGEE